MQDRRILTALTLVVLLALLVTGALVGWRSLSAPVAGGTDGTGAPEPCPSVQPGDVVKAKDVTVSVYNAGTRAGLAARTRDELTARGFIAGDVGNAPGPLRQVERVRVLAPAKKDPAARLVARQFGKRTVVQVYDDDLGAGVDVVVGDDFQGLVKAKKRIKAKVAAQGC